MGGNTGEESFFPAGDCLGVTTIDILLIFPV